MESKRTAGPARWAPWLCAGAGFFLALKSIYDPDNDWHLAAGRWMIEHRSFIFSDPFSYTFQGKPWVSITWLHEILTYFLELCAGDAGFVLGTSLLAALTLLVLFGACRKISQRPTPWASALLVITVGMASSPRWAGRPEMWSHLLGSVFVLRIVTLLSAERRDFSPWAVWRWLIPVQVLWANTHGVFIMGPILILSATAVLLLDRDNWRFGRQLAGACLGVILACVVNPRGIAGALFPFHLLDVLRSPVFGRMIPEATTPFGAGLWAKDALVLLSILGVYSAVLVAALFYVRRDLRVQKVILWTLGLLVGVGYTAVTARRNIPLVALWCLPGFSLALELLVPTPRQLLRLSAALGGVMLLASAPNIFFEKSRLAREGFRSWSTTPEGAANFVATHRFAGRAFATVSVANYFLWRFPNNFSPYIDSRFAEVYDASHFKRYMDILAYPQKIEAEVQSYGIDHVIVGHDLPLAGGLVNYLATQSERWRLVYLDHLTAIFEANLASAHSGWTFVESAPVPTAQLPGLGRGLALVGDLKNSEKIFTRAVNESPQSFAAVAGLCNARWLACDAFDRSGSCAARALEVCEAALRLEPDSVQAMVTGALAAQALGRIHMAQSLLQRAVVVDPISFEAAWSLSRLLKFIAQENHSAPAMDRAIRAYRTALALRPNNGETMFEFADLLSTAGAHAEAETLYRQVLQQGAPAPVAEIIKKRLRSNP